MVIRRDGVRALQQRRVAALGWVRFDPDDDVALSLRV